MDSQPARATDSRSSRRRSRRRAAREHEAQGGARCDQGDTLEGTSGASAQLRDLSRWHAAGRGRALSFDAAKFARRNVIERCENKLEQWQGFER
ncbi:MAG TPA: hypothetical protein VNA27_16590 [Rubrobacteraceae bacterium]|nr:hypothetical protein [Rubrobacteraceae bacterium]